MSPGMELDKDTKAFFDIINLDSDFKIGLKGAGGSSCLFLLKECISLILRSDFELVEKYASEAREKIWEYLHCGNWKDVSPVLRQAYGYSCSMQAIALMERKRYTESINALDMALIMAGPNCSSVIHKLLEDSSRMLPQPEEFLRPYILKSKKETIQLLHPIPRISARNLTLDDFHTNYLITSTPVIICDALERWPALGLRDKTHMWKNINYLRRIAGHRTVPIEVGKNYMDHEWGQKLMTLEEFITLFIIPAATSENDSTELNIAYLAQHNLFQQIPALARDFYVPDYCALGRNEPTDDYTDDVTTNAWFGPQGTVSPLHFDPRDNLFGQVFGRKYIRLYGSEDSPKLYPSGGVMNNTSEVDVENVDMSAFPAFAHARYSECVLDEGELLYIPLHCWHYVRSLAVSFSVNFWW